MEHSSSFVQDLALVAGVAGVTGYLSRLLRQPSILGYLLAGLIVGPYLPVPLFADPARVHSLSEFGVVLVMFAVGLEFRIQKFLEVLPISGLTALIEITALAVSGYFLGRAFGWTELASIFLGACLCISSTMAVSKIFEQQPVTEDSRRTVFGVLVLQDVAAIALIAVTTALAEGANASFEQVLGILGKLLAVLLFIVGVGMFGIPRVVRGLVALGSRETLVVGAVGLCFAFAVFAEQLGYSAALGAFLAGILVAESGEGHKVDRAMASLRDVFAAVFFVSIGMSVDPLLAWKYLDTSLIVLCVVILAQFVSVSLGGLLSGGGLRRSGYAGLALGQIGEFAFIISAIGVAARVVGPELQPVLVTVAVLSTFTTALLLRHSDAVIGRMDRLLPSRLHRLLAVYESWLEDIRVKKDQGRHPLARVIRAIVFDLLLMVVMVFAFRAWEPEIHAFFVDTLSLPAEHSYSLATFALGMALVPLIITLIWGARRVAQVLVTRVFDEEPSSARRFLQGVLLSCALAVVGIPVAALLGPVMGAELVWPSLLIAVALAALLVWRQAGVLDDELQSGGAVMLRAIAEQGLPDAEHESHNPPLAGLTNLLEVTLAESDYAVGRTLAELQLRSLTGASVVALSGPRHSVHLPTGMEALEQQDKLFVAGCRSDQEAAESLLRLGPEMLDRGSVSKAEPGSAVGAER